MSLLPQRKKRKTLRFFSFQTQKQWRNSVNHHGVAGIFTDFYKIFKFPKMIHLDLRIFFLQMGGWVSPPIPPMVGGEVFTPVFTPRVASIRSISAGCWSTSKSFATWILKRRLGERVLFPPKRTWNLKMDLWKKEIPNLDTIRNFRFQCFVFGWGSSVYFDFGWVNLVRFGGSNIKTYNFTLIPEGIYSLQEVVGHVPIFWGEISVPLALVSSRCHYPL